MKLVFALVALAFTAQFSPGFTTEPVRKTNKPEHQVGFKTLLFSDTSRRYAFSSKKKPAFRPIRIFLWYPASGSQTKREFLRFGDYVFSGNLTKNPSRLSRTEKTELESRLAKSLEYFNVSPSQVQMLMRAKTGAVYHAPVSTGRFPLIVLGNAGEGFYYSATAEYLASKGFVVIGLPSIGAGENEPCGYDLACVDLQQNDMEFAIRKISSLPFVDSKKVGLIAWSFSGLAVSLIAMKNNAVKAVVSLDAATGYEYGKKLIEGPEGFKTFRHSPPLLHFYGLSGNSRVAKSFDFFNSYPTDEKQLHAMKELQHSDFISLYGNWVRYAKGEKEQKVLDDLTEVKTTTLAFLNKYLRNAKTD